MEYSTDDKKILDIAYEMLHQKIDLILGCRQICNLASKINKLDDEVFTDIRAVDSDTDYFPIGLARNNCSVEYLTQVDQEKEEYLDDMKKYIFNACNEIIEKFANSTSEFS